MHVEDCPKNLKHCPEKGCPLFPCWAYEKHMDSLDKNKRDRDAGWE